MQVKFMDAAAIIVYQASIYRSRKYLLTLDLCAVSRSNGMHCSFKCCSKPFHNGDTRSSYTVSVQG